MCTTLAFRPFYWLYPGMYQPLQATAILLADLLKTPHSPEAQHSRTLVERLFSHIGSDGVGWYKEADSKRNLSTAGKEVWEMLRRLRRQAWKKAGLDPDMVWTDRNFTPSADTTGNAAATQTEPLPLNPDQAPVGTPGSRNIVPPFDYTSTPVPSSIAPMQGNLWASNLDIGLGNTDLSGQFTLGDVDGFDWGEWDFLLERYFNMPDPGQIQF